MTATRAIDLIYVLLPLILYPEYHQCELESRDIKHTSDNLETILLCCVNIIGNIFGLLDLLFDWMTCRLDSKCFVDLRAN